MSRKKKLPKNFKTALKQRLFFIFFGLCLAGVGILMLSTSGQVNTLDCRRVESTQIECVNHTRWLGVLPLGGQAIHQLQGASVARNCSKSSRDKNSNLTCTFSIDLITAAGPVSLSPFLASGGNEDHKNQFVQQINSFVHDSNLPSLHAVYTEMGPQTVVIGLVLLLGLMMITISTGRAIRESRQA